MRYYQDARAGTASRRFEWLPNVITQAIVPAVQEVANGVVLLLIMIFLPRGLIDPRAIKLRREARTGLGKAT